MTVRQRPGDKPPITVAGVRRYRVSRGESTHNALELLVRSRHHARVSSEGTTDHLPVPARLGNLMVWLGGGTWRDIEEPGERAGYQAAGFVVLLGALVAWGVTAGALVSVGALHLPAALAATLVVGLLAGAQGRVLASAPGRRGTLVGLGLVAVLTGAVLGDLAALIIFGGSLGPQLDVRADRAAAAAVDSSDSGRQLAALRAERTLLDQRIDQVAARRDEALLVARCEYRPSPGCPPQLITGEPGRGPEAEQARAALAGADADLGTARAERDRRAPELDRAIATTGARVEQDRDAAVRLAREDTGVVAHWSAMNDYTGAHPAALLPRLAAVLVLVLLLAAPLLLRLWRGTTDQDRLTEARRRRRYAEQDADTAIAIRRAEVRAARELGLLDATLDATIEEPAALTATATVEPDQLPARTALPAATGPDAPDSSAPGTELATTKRAELLDRLPGPLPVIGRTVTGIAGAFVPAPIARMAAGRPRPMRMVRTLWDEVEEFQFSVLRRRKVTVTEEHYDAPADPDEHRLSRVPARADYIDRVPAQADYIDAADAQSRLAGEPEPASLERGRRELPAADRTD